jgi:hypothetical protein
MLGLGEARFREAEVMVVDLYADTVATPTCCREIGRTGTHKWIENRIANETEHANKAFCKLDRIRRRMIPR